MVVVGRVDEVRGIEAQKSNGTGVHFKTTPRDPSKV